MAADLVTPWAVEHACMRHDELVAKACLLRGEIGRSLSRPSSRPVSERIGVKLSGLVDDLIDLLRIKRESGYFDGTAGNHTTRLQSEIGQLDQDWELLVSDLTSLAEQLKRNRTSRSMPSRIQKCFRVFDELDLRESRIVQDLWSYEIGSPDALYETI